MSMITLWIFRDSDKLFRYANLAFAKNNRNSKIKYVINITRNIKPIFVKKLGICMSKRLFQADAPRVDMEMKNTKAGTAI